ncbi:MAG: lysoplasmalogenase [Bacteroidaceae bacterium]|nr:lysoplasmalogenase [Bacteroidaceae bacterium]
MRVRASAVIAVFLLAAAWYFFPAATWHVFPAGKETFPPLLFAMRLALPAAVLAAGGIGLLPWLMTLGFCFCTLGDAMGVAGSFEGQMGGFALAQICFIVQFAKDIRRSAKAVPRRKPHPVAFLAATLLCLPPLVLAALKVIPAVKELPIRIGCTFYALLLVLASWTSIVRAFTVRNYIAMAGCLCFLVSDFILSWNKFTEHIPRASLLIMSTYYAALLLLFCGTAGPRAVRNPGRA